jgi:hypothetical protein
MKEDRKALQDSIREIKMSFKRSQLETQRMKLLDRFGSKTNKYNQLLSQVPKETEVEMTTDNQMIEKNEIQEQQRLQRRGKNSILKWST